MDSSPVQKATMWSDWLLSMQGWDWVSQTPGKAEQVPAQEQTQTKDRKRNIKLWVLQVIEINYVTYCCPLQKFTMHEKINMCFLHLYVVIKII